MPFIGKEDTMKLDALRLSYATGIVFAIAWVICSLLVVTIPGAMMQMGGHMIHADLSAMGWSMQWTGFFIGLALWTLLSALFVWAIATIYNRLIA